MDDRQIRKIPWLVAVAYGITLGVLGALGAHALGVVAIVGAAIVGFTYVTVNAFSPSDRGRNRDRDRARNRGRA